MNGHKKRPSIWDREMDDLISEAVEDPPFDEDFDDDVAVPTTSTPAAIVPNGNNKETNHHLVDALKGVEIRQASLTDTNKCHVMLAAVIEALCKLVEPNPRKREKMIQYVSRSLISMDVTAPLAFDDCLYSVREHMRTGLAQLLTASQAALTHTAVDNHHIRDSIFPSSPSSHNAHGVISALMSGPTRNRLQRRVASESESADLWGCRYERDFQELSSLGKGGFGHVFKVVCRLDGCHYAVKKIAFDVGDFSLCYKVLREVQLLARLNHAHVVRYYSAWIELDTEPEKRHTIRGRKDSHAALIRELSDESHTNEHYDRSRKCRLRRSLSNPSIVFMDSGDHEHHHHHDHHHHPPSPSPKLVEHSSPALHCHDVSQGGSEPSQASPKGFWVAPGSSTSDQNSQWSVESKALVPLDRENHIRRAMLHFKPITRSLLLHLQMELCQSTLRDYLLKRNHAASTQDRYSCVNTEENERILRQLISALEYIHSKDLIHRDIKPSNIFLRAPSNDVLIGDFGLACLATSEGQDAQIPAAYSQNNPIVEEVQTPTSESNFDVKEEQKLAEEDAGNSTPMRHSRGVGTLTYSAPEQLSASLYGPKVDIYSAGVVAYELYFPFKTYMEKIHLLMNLRDAKADHTFQKRWPVEAGVIVQMVSHDPNLRPSAKQLLGKSFFSGKDSKFQTLEKENEVLRSLLLKHGISPPD